VTDHDSGDAPGPVPAGPALGAGDAREITALHAEYCASVDAGDFARFARLFSRGTWLGMPGSEVEEWMHRNVLTYGGATYTRHRVHGITLTPGSSPDEVHGTCAIEVTQQFPDEQAVLVTDNTYADRFRRHDGLWQFASRAITRRLPGDDSRHRRPGGRPTTPDGDEEGSSTCGSSTA